MTKIKDYIFEQLEKKKALLAALIDPLDYSSQKSAVLAAKEAEEGGADYILIGGSIGVDGEFLDEITKEIKSQVSLPIILFPGNISTLTKYADAIYFMSLLNSSNSYWITKAQMLAVPSIERLKLEPLGVGYIVVEPGGTVGWVGDAKLIPRSKPQVAALFAKAAQYFGFDFVLVDSGSNPSIGPVNGDFIKPISASISIPLIVAGGIRTPTQASELVKAGASILQVGTLMEKSSNIFKSISLLSKAIKDVSKK